MSVAVTEGDERRQASLPPCSIRGPSLESKKRPGREHQAGTSRKIAVPAPGRESINTVPPTS